MLCTLVVACILVWAAQSASDDVEGCRRLTLYGVLEPLGRAAMQPSGWGQKVHHALIDWMRPQRAFLSLRFVEMRGEIPERRLATPAVGSFIVRRR